jgi:hypothetical protein
LTLAHAFSKAINANVIAARARRLRHELQWVGRLPLAPLGDWRPDSHQQGRPGMDKQQYFRK